MSGRYVENNKIIESQNMQNYNINNNHPLIPNSQQYMVLNKYISIHSEDRDLTKFPRSSEFEIELPEDLVNVASLRLINWTFPANYNTFSPANGNDKLFYKITNPYNPAAFGLTDEYNYRIYEALFMTQQEPYDFVIEEGFYNPVQMSIELTNKFNYNVSKRIRNYFSIKGWNDTLNEFNLKGGYTRFIIVYNNVSLKLWFGNRADEFTILNEINIIENTLLDGLCLPDFTHVPDNSNWGLSSYLGLPRCNSKSVSSSPLTNISSFEEINGITVPRFYYGDVLPGDDGFWLLPYTDFIGRKFIGLNQIIKLI